MFVTNLWTSRVLHISTHMVTTPQWVLYKWIFRLTRIVPIANIIFLCHNYLTSNAFYYQRKAIKTKPTPSVWTESK